MTTSEFREVMTKKADSDLIKILTVERDQFLPEAIIAAEEEFKKRNLTVDQVETVKTELTIEKHRDHKKANEPLDQHWKIFACIFPGFINIVFYGLYKADGYDRKASELGRWTLYGFGIYFGLILVISMLN
jgi:hypothetical protein